MVLAGAFAVFLFIGLIVGDWAYFVRLTADASRYGFGIARGRDQVDLANLDHLRNRFDSNGVLTLPHGMARFFPEHTTLTPRQPDCYPHAGLGGMRRRAESREPRARLP